MPVTVRLFAGLRERAGWSIREIEAPTVGDVWKAIGLDEEPAGLLYAVNREYAPPERESRGREVLNLEYEAYAEMAEDVMARLAAELEERHDLCAVAIHHRVGNLEVGETSVVIAVSAPHRH